MLHRLLRSTLPVLLAASTLFATACDPTPESILRYVDTEGSEERFAGYIQNPRVSQEVRVRALELLFNQWQYSSTWFVGARVIKDIPDSELRSQTLRDFLPFLRAQMQEEATELQARDAVFHLRNGTENRQIRGEYNDLLVTWVESKWVPCRERAGVLGPSTILGAVPAERVAPALAERIRTGSIPDVECQRRALEREVEWVWSNELLASAWLERWREGGGRYVENEQLNFTLFEHVTLYREQDAVRSWMFGMLADENTPSLFTNAVLDVLSTDVDVQGDVDRYLGLLGAPRLIRWAAFERVIARDGSQGLRRALAAMPATADNSYYDGELRPDGFELAARNIVCAIPRLEEFGDNSRAQFEDAVRTSDGPARLLSLVCLERFGDAGTVQRLTVLRDTLGPEPLPAPGFGAASVQDVFSATITAIETRLQGPTP